MNLISMLVERKLNLCPPITRHVVVERDIRVPMPDGAELLADRWVPRNGGDGLPQLWCVPRTGGVPNSAST